MYLNFFRTKYAWWSTLGANCTSILNNDEKRLTRYKKIISIFEHFL